MPHLFSNLSHTSGHPEEVPLIRDHKLKTRLCGNERVLNLEASKPKLIVGSLDIQNHILFEEVSPAPAKSPEESVSFGQIKG